jgi:hypothetical protein
MEAAIPHRGAQREASPALWWDDFERDAAEPLLETDKIANIAIVGGGYTGL